MSNEHLGCIYILTNQAFPDYIKIGYAIDVKERLKRLKKSIKNSTDIYIILLQYL